MFRHGTRGFRCYPGFDRLLRAARVQRVDAWGIDGPERYASVPRLGRRSPLGPRQRERLWSVLGAVATALREQAIFTRCGACREVAAHYSGRERKPFDHIVVDEAQDLGPAELSLTAGAWPKRCATEIQTQAWRRQPAPALPQADRCRPCDAGGAAAGRQAADRPCQRRGRVLARPGGALSAADRPRARPERAPRLARGVRSANRSSWHSLMRFSILPRAQ